ncbi:MAG: tryptophan--tRNA ligase, partial [Minisyncoccales bacterium]
LNMNAYLGELERTTSFKDKARQQPENVNAGLLTYPVLMAADIIIHQANKVPVGKDQEQNLEMTRKFANRFNRIYGSDYFTIPQPFNFGESLVKIPGLDGSGKMGKSEGNGIYLAEEPSSIRKKVMKAVTDSGPEIPNSPISEPIQNLFTIMSVVSEPEVVAQCKDDYARCSIRYGDLKKKLAEDIINFTDPIREKIKAIASDDTYLRKVAEMGREKAHESAAKTIKEVREIIGFKPF